MASPALSARLFAGWERRLVTLSVGLTVASVVWFAVAFDDPSGPRAIGWAPAIIVSTLAGFMCWSTARDSQQRAVTRFWRQIAGATFLVVLATAARAVESMDPAADIRLTGVPSLVLFVIAVFVNGWALLQLPLGLTGARNRWRFFLDAGTVMVSSALFIWYLSVRPALGGRKEQEMLPRAVASALALVLLFAVVKAVMTASATVDPGALRALGLTFLVGTFGSVPEALLPGEGATLGQIILPVTGLLGMVAAMRQRRAAAPAEPVDRRGKRRRSFSILPYSAVAASSGLLLYSTTTSDPTNRLIIAGVVVGLVVLVVVRQLVAFADNNHLVNQLDAGMSELRASERRFRSLVQNSSDMITVTGPDGRFTYISPGARRVLGIDPDEWIGRSATGLVHPDDLPAVRQHAEDLRPTLGASTVFEVRLAHGDGSWRWMEISTTNLVDDPAIGGTVGNARDVTDERAFQQRLHHLAHHDSLTQLANRELFHQRIGAALSAGRPEGLRLLLVDLNEFKAVNDTLGHAAGDSLLMVIAERMLACLRPGDTVARLGGDEFAVLAHDVTDDELTVLMRTLMDVFTEPVDTIGYHTRIGASIGVVTGQAGATAEELLRRADIAMYAAKADRSGALTRYAVYTEALDSPIMERVALEEELRAAVAGNQFRLQYQPIVTVGENRVGGVEALVRWAHPERGLLAPAHFVPFAERSDLIVGIGRWVLTEACEQASRWYAEYGEQAPHISVNVSARQLHDPQFRDYLAATLLATGLPPHRLTVEITETTALHPQSVDVLQAVHDLSVRISLDDFGTGQSTLSLLQSCPVDEVKLDRSFVRTATTAGERSVAAALIQLADALNLDVVAEGVETAEQATHLTRLGYRYLQGFHFARPDWPDEIDRLISERRSGQPLVTSARPGGA